jgi:type IV secretory pathway VirB10-like protein
MSDKPTTTPDPPPVTDHRPVPRGVLPRGIQTWVMLAVAGGMMTIIFAVGRPNPPARQTTVVTPAPVPSPDRVLDYQQRLRAAEAQAAQSAQAAVLAPMVPPPANNDLQPVPTQDPLKAERKRREYESLFASNVVLSRRPEGQRPDAGGSIASASTRAAARDPAGPPSIDEIADAAVRASVRANAASQLGAVGEATPGQSTPTPNAFAPAARVQRPAHTGPISAAGPMHRLLEGTLIDTVLTNRVDGGVAAPVNCLVTTPVYSHGGRQVVIPAGARVLGETRPVQTFGETRLAVTFHRLAMPDGSTYSLDQFLGLNQIGDSGLRDQVNQHYWSTFGAAAAVGLISGLAQFVGTAGLATGEGNRTVIIAGGAADASSQASVQTMNRFLNRLPTITIREGHRVQVYLTSDLELPAYPSPGLFTRF